MSMLRGEWVLCEKLINECQWPISIAEFQRANTRFHLQKHLPQKERDKNLADALWSIEYDEAWDVLLQLHLTNTEWDRAHLNAKFWTVYHDKPDTDILDSLPPRTWVRLCHISDDYRTSMYVVLFQKDITRRLNPFLFQKIIHTKDTNLRLIAMSTMIQRFPILTQMPFCEKGDLQASVMDDYVASSAGILVFNSHLYLVNVRRVNYRIMPAGNYISIVNGSPTSEYNGITKNEYYFMDRETLRPVVPCRHLCEEIQHRRTEEKAIVGIEDIRLLHGEDDDIYFYGVTREFSYCDAIRIIFGKYDIDRGRLCDTVVIHPPYEENACEKNWVHCGHRRFIYQWHPIEIGSVNPKHKLIIEERIESPPFFKEFRGSSPGVSYGGYKWFIVHSVMMIGGRRKYLHYIVLLDIENQKKVVATTPPFCFEGSPIEYSIGMDIYKGKILLTYSINDCHSRYVRLPLSHIINMLIFPKPHDKELFYIHI
jgi:hypothetical protein